MKAHSKNWDHLKEYEDNIKKYNKRSSKPRKEKPIESRYTENERTNATKLNEKLIHQILKSGMTDLVFSVDSYYKEEFESLRVRAVFEDVVENIKKFKEIRDKDYPNSGCVTRASGVQVSEKQDPQKFEDFWNQYVDFVVMVRMLNRANLDAFDEQK